MCRSTENQGFYQNERDRLKIRAFYLRLTISNADKPLPESSTLLYLPRISGSPLEINGSKIRSDSVAFVTLHRVRSAEKESSNSEQVREAIFASRERVRASEGVRFEVYLSEEKVLKGIFRKDDKWKLECKCELEKESIGFEISEADVCVVSEGHVGINEKVKMAVRRRRKCRGFERLEEIPEEREVDVESDDCDCCYGGDHEADGEKNEENEMEMEMEMEMEGVRWAVDVGIWVMCLGVGYLVSKASSKSLRRRKISFL